MKRYESWLKSERRANRRTKLPSAINRYAEEIHRITSVLNCALKSSPSGSLVGDKISYADISFASWQSQLKVVNGHPLIERKLDDWETLYPTVSKWLKTILDRPAIQSAIAVQKKLSEQMTAKIEAGEAVHEKTS